MKGESRPFSAVTPLPDMPDTEALGARIARGLGRGETVALQGDLGAGKTTLARAILRSLGVSEDVPSPTFTLVQSYETDAFPVRHFDLYRIEDEEELDELGFDEAVDEGVVLVEWPERAPHRIPADALHVDLSVNGTGMREAKLSGPQHWNRIFENANAG
ncbi:MAG TPA: tRNA (adenosine(37)-N6)-threonylcarbamoyltransferase complex ATPase subunit type 1 TsaE [Rhizomicrobium sp.]|jgi:tRNA threonylcarbamoyl adenosine modification protein YjeE|nr:tRNA (adenosine(37)-N6)-threonylcarbamoyltransferase complex ATPase subunit type 1 TsaE [Rhizomicrobium sp.]